MNKGELDIREVCNDEFSDFAIIKMVVKILKSTH